MKVTLLNESNEGAILRLGVWADALRLGQRYGWVPAGTLSPGFTHLSERVRRENGPGEVGLRYGVEPTPIHWTGSYLSHGAWVTAPDALALGQALWRAYPDLPERRVRGVHRRLPPTTLVQLLQRLGGEGASLRKVIAVCHYAAPFSIDRSGAWALA